MWLSLILTDWDEQNSVPKLSLNTRERLEGGNRVRKTLKFNLLKGVMLLSISVIILVNVTPWSGCFLNNTIARSVHSRSDSVLIWLICSVLFVCTTLFVLVVQSWQSGIQYELLWQCSNSAKLTRWPGWFCSDFVRTAFFLVLQSLIVWPV